MRNSSRARRTCVEENNRGDDQAGNQEQAQKRAAANNQKSQARDGESARQPAEFLHGLRARGRLAALGCGKLPDFRKSRGDLRRLLHGPECGSIGAGEQQGGNDGAAAKLRPEEFGDARPLERSLGTPLLPLRRLRQEGANQHQRNRRSEAGHQCIAPCGMSRRRSRADLFRSDWRDKMRRRPELRPAKRTTACSRARPRVSSASGNSSASHATAAMNSTQTPAKHSARNRSSVSIRVDIPADSADTV